MTLQQLLYFRDIAHTLHFGRSAENLFVSQSSLSYSINTLERELGVSLFQRHNGKKVTLSQYGEEFLPYVENILRNVDNGLSHLHHMQNSLSGVVRISYGYINGVSIIAPMFREFYKNNSDLDIRLQFQINNASHKIEKDVLSRDIDITFSSSSDVKGLNQFLFTQQELVVMLPKNHPLSSRRKLTIEDIREQPLIGYHEGGNLSKYIYELYREYGYRPNFTEFQSDWTQEVAYIAMGLGIGILPRIPIDENTIDVIPLDHPKHIRNIYMLWSPDLSPAAEYVKDFCISWAERQSE